MDVRIRGLAVALAVSAFLPLVMAGSCSQDVGIFLQLEVHGVGSGSGTVSTPSGRLSCSVTAGVIQGDCTETYANESDLVTVTAQPAAGSVFLGWLNNDVYLHNSDGDIEGVDYSICEDPANPTCTVRLTLDQVTLTPHFGLPGVTDRYVAVRYSFYYASGNSREQPDVDIEIATPERDIACASPFNDVPLSRCWAMRPEGSTLSLAITMNGAPAGYFHRWQDCTASGMNCTVTMTGDSTTAVALFGPREDQRVFVTPEGPGGGRVTSQPAGLDCGWNGSVQNGTCQASFAMGSAVTITSAPQAGSSLASWGNSCIAPGPCQVEMWTGQALSPRFDIAAPTNHSLQVTGAGTGTGTITSTPPGITCISTAGVTSGTCVASVGAGSTMNLSASPAAGSTFTGWSAANCPGVSVCAITVNGATTVTATFTATSTFTLTLQQGSAITGNGSVTSSPSGINCTFVNGQSIPTGTCAFAFPANAAVTLTPTPVAPSTFVTFTGASSCGFGVTTCVVTMDQNRTMGVIFNP